jgi:hypothetical protein
MEANMQNKQMVAANRMVEVKRANCIYVSPIVKTVLMKTWLRNSWVLPEADDPDKAVLRQYYATGVPKVPQSSNKLPGNRSV